jgi:FG-GAP-like repeat
MHITPRRPRGRAGGIPLRILRLLMIAGALCAMFSGSASAQSPTNDGFGTSKRGDFNGDGRGDIVTFSRGTGYRDVFVALSDGQRFNGTGVKWHDSFAVGDEVPEVGDFNCDGRDDIVRFTRGSKADVFVALSDGTRFSSTGALWHESFAAGNEVPMVGDFNGDGCDDIATFTRGSAGDVFVALSNGHTFVGSGIRWHDSFAVDDEVPAVGDFNGDGRDDIATFTRTHSLVVTKRVFVALSDGKRFNGNGVNWGEVSLWFTHYVPAVGDFNGDGRDDIARFTRGSDADVSVGLSDGKRFNVSSKWHDQFAAGTELPGTGDFNGDGRDDIVTFTRGSAADVFVALSDGTRFTGNGVKWHDLFAVGNEIPAPAMIW